MTGLNRKAFEALLPIFTAAYESSRLQEHQQRQPRCSGRRQHWDVEIERLLLLTDGGPSHCPLASLMNNAG